eukprot:TRINITY_DN1896_c0_g1_i1.p1 TRINITY_DN1896_c0_g1~~TRINITY_DN1896_c0_g1_i1.p1  ORF type:complete len:1017 (-),score=181.39 TRINITY_DN1896_c0_g1_i1:270-3320(-)
MSSSEENVPLSSKSQKYGSVGVSTYNVDGTFSNTGFSITPEDLTDLIEKEDIGNLDRLGGLNKLCKALKTDKLKGICETDHTNRINAYGRNVYPEAEHETWLGLFLEAFQDVAVIILSIAAVISLVAGTVASLIGESNSEWIEGVAILVAVLIVAVVSATNNYMKDLQFRALKAKSSDELVAVVRNGDISHISTFTIMVGDIISLSSGDKIPADGIFIPSFDELHIDESSLTGEPDNQIKNVEAPFLFAECYVRKGSGHMLVTGVGENSKWGRVYALLPDDKPPTPLQEKLEDMVVLIGKVGLFVAAVVFLVLVGFYLGDKPWEHRKEVLCYYGNFSKNGYIECAGHENKPINDREGMAILPPAFDPMSLMEVLRAFIVSVTIVVVAVPEGLPLAVTISLAYSMAQMMKDQNLVRHLSACETMGGATNICSDKTGTLTQNRMTVVEGIIAGKVFTSTTDLEGLEDEVKDLLIQSCCINWENGSIENTTPGALPIFHGSVTECALFMFAKRLGYDYKELQSRANVVKKWGFTSERKRMSSIIKLENKARLYCKGASEIVLKLCAYVLDENGNPIPMSPKVHKQLNEHIVNMAKKGLRTLCLAYRDMYDYQDIKSDDGVGYEEEMICVGIVGIEDPLRPEVPDSVRLCKRAGITVRMVTGDNILTARKIATDCGILTNGESLEGPEFSKKTDEEIDVLLPRLQVLARSSPSDKYRLVERLIENGEVVAVTGDGTNDGPALSKADVGLAMGIQGTKVAKQAADIIILDDNFASIVRSVMWGRCVYDNIRKFLQFQLTVNVVALIVAFIGAVSSYGTPLTAVQLLWVNLIMDSMAALALGTEKPTLDLLNRKPYGRSGKLITLIMWRNILGQALFQVGVLFAILYALDEDGNHLMFPGVKSGKEANDQGQPSVHYTMVFNTFVFLQIFNEINARKVNTQLNVFSGILTNPLYCGILVVTIFVQVIIVEFGGDAVQTTQLDWVQWLYCVGIAYMTLPYGFILRLIPVPLEEWEKEVDYDQY